MEFIFSKHALEQIGIRQISQSVVEDVLANPDQVLEEDGKRIYQSVILSEKGGNYLIRIFVNVVKQPNVIITVYKTSRINKYYEGKI